MTGREWKPGDVASILINSTRPAFRTDAGWTYVDGSTGGLFADDFDFRPLVVLDPENDEQVQRLMLAIDVAFEPDLAPRDDWDEAVPTMQAALREFANPTPPKPAEPTGLGAVVEDAEGRLWTLPGGPIDGDKVWYAPDLNYRLAWSQITAVRVLSEGVTPC